MCLLIIVINSLFISLVVSETPSNRRLSSNALNITTGPIHRTTMTHTDSTTNMSITTETRTIITKKPIKVSSQNSPSHISGKATQSIPHTSTSSPLSGYMTMITLSLDKQHGLSFLITTLHSSNTQIPLTRGCTSRREDNIFFIAVFYLTIAENTSYTFCHTSGSSLPKIPSIKKVVHHSPPTASSPPHTHPPILHLELGFTLLYTSVTESTVTLDNAPATDVYTNVFSMSVSCLTSVAY